MDIPRPGVARQKRMRRTLYGAMAAVAILLITLGLSRLKPAAPTVERATVWIDQVKRGPMLRQVRGLGTLVPEEIRWIPAQTVGRVERRVIELPLNANGDDARGGRKHFEAHRRSPCGRGTRPVLAGHGAGKRKVKAGNVRTPRPGLSSLSEGPSGRFSPRSHLLTASFRTLR